MKVKQRGWEALATELCVWKTKTKFVWTTY